MSDDPIITVLPWSGKTSLKWHWGGIWEGPWKSLAKWLRWGVHPVGVGSKHRGLESSYKSWEDTFCFSFYLRFRIDNALQFEGWILSSISFTVTFRIITFETETFYTLAKCKFCYLSYAYQSSFLFSVLMEKIYYFYLERDILWPVVWRSFSGP